jgi:hypothetical protein
LSYFAEVGASTVMRRQGEKEGRKMSDLLFYRNDGRAAVGHIGSGSFVNTFSTNFVAIDWSIIVPAMSPEFGNHLLFYRADGLAALMPISDHQAGNSTPINHLSHNWSKIIPVNDYGPFMRSLLFYSNDGRAAVGHFEFGAFGIPAFVNTDIKTDFTENWTQIVVSGSRDVINGIGQNILFYRTDGRVALGHLSLGKFVNTFSGNIAPDWSMIVRADIFSPSSVDGIGNWFLFYRADGQAAVAHIQEGPPNELVFTDFIGDFTQNWSQIIFTGRDIIFYRNDGVAAVGHVEFPGKLIITDSHSDFTQNWSKIILAEDFTSPGPEILFYRNDGRAAVGHINESNGKFVNTEATSGLTENWTHIVRTPLVLDDPL